MLVPWRGDLKQEVRATLEAYLTHRHTEPDKNPVPRLLTSSLKPTRRVSKPGSSQAPTVLPSINRSHFASASEGISPPGTVSGVSPPHGGTYYLPSS